MKQIYKKLILWTLLILQISLIFSFSVQNTDDSAALSKGFTDKIKTTEEFEDEIRNEKNDDGKINESRIKLLAERDFLKLEGIFRKLAHMTLFFILGLLIIFLIEAYGIIQWFCVLISPVFAMAVGFFDETIQLFSVGRAGSLSDVFIDFAGAVAASVFFFAGGKIYGKIKEKRFKMDSGKF